MSTLVWEHHRHVVQLAGVPCSTNISGWRRDDRYSLMIYFYLLFTINMYFSSKTINQIYSSKFRQHLSRFTKGWRHKAWCCSILWCSHITIMIKTEVFLYMEFIDSLLALNITKSLKFAEDGRIYYSHIVYKHMMVINTRHMSPALIANTFKRWCTLSGIISLDFKNWTFR